MNPLTIGLIGLVLIIVIVLYRKIISKQPNYTDIEKVLALTDVYLAYGQYKEAINVLKKALDINPGDLMLSKKYDEVRKTYS